MTAEQFRNALRVMYSLDEIADILPPEKVKVFHRDPMAAVFRMDEPTWAKAYGLIEARCES